MILDLSDQIAPEEIVPVEYDIEDSSSRGLPRNVYFNVEKSSVVQYVEKSSVADFVQSCLSVVLRALGGK